MKSLREIFAEGSSDKSALHAYDLVYSELFRDIRLKPVKLLELGFLGGDSLEAWAKYFPNGDIHGLDLIDRLYRPTDQRIHISFGDSSKREVLEGLGDNWTVIIDDASHFASHQIEAFNVLWSRLAPGGLYVIEDTHCVHSAVHCDHPYNIINYFGKVCCDMQDPTGDRGSAKYDPEHPWSDIEYISMRKGMIIVKKRNG